MDRRSFHKLAGLGALGALSGATELDAQNAANPTHRLPPPSFRQPAPIDFEDHTGFVQIFDGKTLQHWDGNPDVWRVEDGCIVGVSTHDKPAGN
ncbi:MAG: hypothetical protein WBF45_17230, partial [Acidobacteriaceae bacterium]